MNTLLCLFSEAAAAASDLQNFENQMVDRAMNNLPTVISEVFSMQKGQTNDIQALQQAVQQNKVFFSFPENQHGNGFLYRHCEASLAVSKVYAKTWSW